MIYNRLKNKEKSIVGINILIVVFFFITIIYPLITLITKVDFNTFGNLINSGQFKLAFNNSLLVTSISTILSILIAYFLAYAINRCNIRFRAILTVLFTIPMLIPSISHGLGLINLFGTNGIINNIFGLKIEILGFPGIILGSIMYSFPIAFLMITDAFKYIDNNMYENADILGLNGWQKFQKITLFYLRKPLLSCLFAVFTLIFTDYGVPLAIGGRYITLPVFLYNEVIGLLDFSKGAMIGLFLLIPAFVSFIFDTFAKDLGNISSEEVYYPKKNTVRDVIFNIYSYLIIFIEIIIIGSFIVYAVMKGYPFDKTLTLYHFDYVFGNNLSRYLINSLLISVFVSIFGTMISYFAAYFTARSKTKISKLIHILSISSIAIPGIVLGVSYTMSFNNLLIYRTIIIIIIVNIVHFFSSPYLMAYNALGKLNKNFEEVGTTCGISKMKIIRDVIIPNSKDTIIEMLSYFFVNSMITISAVAFLYNTKTMPLSIMINQYEVQMMLEEAAIISLIILIINMIVKTIVYFIKRYNYKRSMI